MRGFPKGLLPAPRSGSYAECTLIEALVREFRAAAPLGEVVLLGQHSAYAGLDLPGLPDGPSGIGPIGGLRALLLEGQARDSDVVVCSCDLPFLDRSLFRRLLVEQPEAAALAAKQNGYFEPFPSRFDPTAALPQLEIQLANERHSLVALLEVMGASELPLAPGEGRYLEDWDEPADMQR
jgi:molybdopterin-guanine dinucleotide biosynthesis protein A